jgi:hypothetical protein
LVQAEATDGMSFTEPLRRYANAVARDIKLGHRGTLTNGELKAGTPVTNTPEVIYPIEPLLELSNFVSKHGGLGGIGSPVASSRQPRI